MSKYNVVKKTVHNNVKRLREKKKLTQQQLAKKARVTLSMVSRIESGERDLNLKLLVRIADGLGVVPESLFRNRRAEEAAKVKSNSTT
jgi:transcriptional regulator with XRE-family HTH domain